MVIRQYHRDDFEQVRTLWIRQLNDGSARNEPNTMISDKLAVQPELFFVGVHQDKIIATAMAGYDGHRGWLYSIAIDLDYQKKGYGRQIVLHALSALRKLGCKKVNLQIRDDNHQVEAFYKTLGFYTEPRISMGILL